MKIIFAQTRHHYASYVDFWRLVDASGFDRCFVDEWDLTDEWTVYIFTPMNGEIMHALEAFPKAQRKARVVWWNLERPSHDETTDASIDKLRGFIHAIWVSDKFCAQDPRFTYVFMASHADIATRSDERIYDVCPLAYLWGRRLACIRELAALGLKVAPNAYGRQAQDGIVAKSRVILNLHQYADAPFVAPLRFAVAAAYAIPIVTERLAVEQPGPIVHAAIEEIPREIVHTLLRYEDDAKLATRGLLLHHRFCIHTNFRHEVEKAVKARWP